MLEDEVGCILGISCCLTLVFKSFCWSTFSRFLSLSLILIVLERSTDVGVNKVDGVIGFFVSIFLE